MNTLTLFNSGTLYTLGYAQPGAAAQLDRLMHHERTLLVDIRLTPWCSWSPLWCSRTLAATYGRRYRWERRLGNLHYKHRERGIQLATGHEEAARQAAHLLRQGVCLILLCGCRDARTCHRSLVAKLIQDAAQALQEESGVPQ